MNEKPQETRADDQKDILEQIITQGLDKMKAPERAEPAGEAPGSETSPALKQEDGKTAAPPAEKKNRRNAVYLYLLVLFGAAFLLLLLAYFIQQRSNETTISDLRESMTLSRDQLLAEIKELEEKNAALEEKNNTLDKELDRWKDDCSKWQEQYKEKEQEVTDLRNQYYDRQKEVYYSWTSFWELEQFYQAGDYKSCAAVLILQRQGQYTYSTPDVALERYEEIVQAVIDKGILDEEYYQHPEDYEELLDAYFSDAAVRLTELDPTDWID